MKKLTYTRVKRKLIRIFFREQWSILLCDINRNILKHIIPPLDFQWADPFIAQENGRTYIFVEQQFMHENGTLGFIELFPDLSHSNFVPILEKPYHLSFPNVFRYRNKWYMIPETHENNTIDLYEANNFPSEWQFCQTLMQSVDAVDSTVFFYNGKWWLFTSIKNHNDNGHLFYSNTFPTSDWTPHPQNPVSKGLANSRLAGAIFCKNEKMYRSAQNCTKDYGWKTNINEIIELSETNFAEKLSYIIEPEKSLQAVCTHTLNSAGPYIVRDIKTRHLRFLQDKS